MKNEIFVLEMPLKVEKWQADILNKRYEYLRQIYNFVQGKLLHQFRYFEQMEDYKACKTLKDKHAFINDHPFYIKGINDKNGNPQPITFNKLSISSFAEKLAKRQIGKDKTYIDVGINTNMIKEQTFNLWSSWDKYLYDYSAHRVAFKKKDELNIFRYGKKGGGFNGMTVNLQKMEVSIKTNGRQGSNATFIVLPIDCRKGMTEYELFALQGGVESINTVAIVRRNVRGQFKYYVQFNIEAEKPQKGRELGVGRVGIDVGPSTVAISSSSRVTIDKLADRCDNIQHDIYIIGRKIDRSRRANNPQNYNEDGTIKRISRQNGERRVWNKSERYKKLQKERAELLRKQAAIRKTEHILKANELLELGDTFIVENNPVSSWTRRAKETKVNKAGRIQSKKRYGKSVANHAPSMFVTILENKVKSLGGTFVKADVKNAASQFDFTSGEFTKHEVGERAVTLSNGDKHQRDMLAAFNLQHLNIENGELKEYDIKQMESDYPNFCAQERDELNRYIREEKKNDRTAIGAFKK